MVLTVCITGASRGIGRALAEVYAKKGAILVLASRAGEELDKLPTALKTVGAKEVYTIPCDFARDGAQVLERFLQEKNLAPDIAMLNAGLGAYGAFTSIPDEKNKEMIGVNITALTSLAHFFARTMSTRKSGSILLTASTAAFEPGPLMTTYFATKAYVLSFGLALREELKAHGVHVSVLCPGATSTGFSAGAHAEHTSVFNAKTMDTPEHVAKAALNGIAANKAIIVPGLKNKLTVFATRLVPRSFAANIVFRSFSKT